MNALRSVVITICLLAIVVRTDARPGKLNIIVDERIELLTTIQYLSGYPIITQANTRYKKDIANYFAGFKDHNAVLLNKKIYRRYFAFDAPPTYIYHFSFPDFKQTAAFSQEDLDGYEFDIHKDTLTLLLSEMKDFYEKTQFHKFYLAHQAFYDSLLQPVKNKIAATDIITVLEKHYGQKNKEYNIVLAPMLNDGGYGPQITTLRGQILYAIVGPKYTSKDVPEFDIDNLLSEYVIHEFSHSFCNTLINKNMAELGKDSCLLAPILASQKEQGYGRWVTCLCEHLVRANEVVLTEKVFGKKKADADYEDMVKNGQWIYLEGLVPIIRQYQANRKKYKTENDIMPLVIAYFHDKAKSCK